MDEKLETAEPVSQPGRVWPASTELVLSESGGRIRIRQQSNAIKSMFHIALRKIYGQLLWENPFPVGATKTKFERDSLYEAARELELHDIRKRLRKDRDYNKRLGDVVRDP